MIRVSRFLVAAVLIASAGCDYVPSEDLLAARQVQEVEEWKERRQHSLLAEDSWLTLIGLEWIGPGSNRIGASPKNEVVVRSENAPQWIGVIVVEKMPGDEEGDLAVVRFVPKPGGEVLLDGAPVEEAIPMLSDQSENPTVLTSGDVQFHLIERSGRLGVRIKDSQAPARLNFAGLEYYPYDRDLRLPATLEPHDKTLPIGDVTGAVQEIPSPGTIRFTIDGTEHELDVLEGGPGRYFVIFADETNGRETYGAGRYLYMDAADASGQAIIDFNQAYNPPCVFSDFATCPLPPRQNRLPTAIRAGEKMYSAGHQKSLEEFS